MTPTLPFHPERSAQDGPARGNGCFSIPPTSGMALTGICMWQRPMALSVGRGRGSAANRSHPAPSRMPLSIGSDSLDGSRRLRFPPQTTLPKPQRAGSP